MTLQEDLFGQDKINNTYSPESFTVLHYFSFWPFKGTKTQLLSLQSQLKVSLGRSEELSRENQAEGLLAELFLSFAFDRHLYKAYVETRNFLLIECHFFFDTNYSID